MHCTWHTLTVTWKHARVLSGKPAAAWVTVLTAEEETFLCNCLDQYDFNLFSDVNLSFPNSSTNHSKRMLKYKVKPPFRLIGLFSANIPLLSTKNIFSRVKTSQGCTSVQRSRSGSARGNHPPRCSPELVGRGRRYREAEIASTSMAACEGQLPAFLLTLSSPLLFALSFKRSGEYKIIPCAAAVSVICSSPYLLRETAFSAQVSETRRNFSFSEKTAVDFKVLL